MKGEGLVFWSALCVHQLMIVHSRLEIQTKIFITQIFDIYCNKMGDSKITPFWNDYETLPVKFKHLLYISTRTEVGGAAVVQTLHLTEVFSTGDMLFKKKSFQNKLDCYFK